MSPQIRQDSISQKYIPNAVIGCIKKEIGNARNAMHNDQLGNSIRLRAGGSTVQYSRWRKPLPKTRLRIPTQVLRPTHLLALGFEIHSVVDKDSSYIPSRQFEPH